MEPRYEIVVNIRVPEGYVEACHFTLAGDYEAAVDLFGKLDGQEAPASSAAIRFEMLEVNDTLSTVLQRRYVILSEAGDNCKKILRETFRILTLSNIKT
ncbi:hypothetical protein A4H97_28105 [Niastella yeongjuensis]|uniref:Uncharacterized protein n=1 Tax=Niastella yeongjuensis TaxID=354355 RepID=A0A1V9EUB1_9BACT|nr:hypothetical protein [Niastella yeongjuensis]OQP49757.1 hypothetical protein A4H97_28105 [Niastella yeongjuensis]SEP40579.1 hypothetical protein SAMN05660816_05814 [Niastella yeongjuensis]